MNTQIAFYLVCLVFGILIPDSLCQTTPEQLIAINNLSDALSQGWDSIDPCSSPTGVTCNGTKIIQLSFKIPSTGPVELNELDLFELTDLTQIYIPQDILLSDLFWRGLDELYNLNKLSIYYLYSFPLDIGTNFPQSLEELAIERLDAELPETILTRTNLKKFSLASQMDSNVRYLPLSISSPSYLQDLTYVSGTGEFLDGSNLVNLTNIYVFYRGINVLNYNKYNTFPALESLSIQLEDTILLSDFPSSLFNIPNLKQLDIKAENKFQLIPSTFTWDFTSSPNLNHISLYDMNTLSLMQFPGVKAVGNGDVILMLNIFDSTIDLNQLDFTTYKIELVLSNTNCTGISSTADYSNVFNVVFQEVTFSNQLSIPEKMCNVKKSITLESTNAVSIPACFLCDWNTTTYPFSRFGNNTNLPAYTQTCPDVAITSVDNSLVNTIGGFVTILGTDMGWRVWDSSGNDISAQVLVGNEVLVVPVPSGTGINKQYGIRLHYISIPTAPVFNITFSYKPPIINFASVISNNAFMMQGDNFGNNISVVTLYVAGKLTPPATVAQYSISTYSEVPPYTTDLVVSVRLNVDSQEIFQVLRPSGSVSLLSKPYPKLYSGGGIVSFYGEYLTYDLSIMNLTINNIPFTNLSSASATKIIFNYEPIPAGNYSMVFNLDTYHVEGYILVTDELPCKVVFGYCLGSVPICDPGYTGPDCSSIPANLTRPSPVNETYPIISQPLDFTINYESSISNFRYQIQPTQIREFDKNGVLLNTIILGDYPFKQEIPSIDPLYLSNNFTTGSYAFIYYWFLEPSVTTTPLGQQWPLIQSSIKVQCGIVGYEFQDPENYLEMDTYFSLEMTNADENTCSFHEHDILPQIEFVDYLKLKVNNIDLYTRFPTGCSTGAGPVQCQPVLKTISTPDTYKKKEATVTLKIPLFTGLYLLEFDNTILIDTISAQDELENVICFEPTSPPVTKPPVENICPGDPICYGHGKCVKSKCQCEDGWEGFQCDGRAEVLPPVDPEPNKPTTNVSTEKIGIHISIVSIRELDFKGDLVKEHQISDIWNYTVDRTESKNSFTYKSNVVNEFEIFVIIDYFLKDMEITFAGETSLKKVGSMKYSANITGYPFEKNINQLQVVFMASAHDQSDYSDSCTVKSIVYSDDDASNVENVYIQVNDETFVGKFTDMAVVDSKNRQVRNVIVPGNISDSNTQSNILVGIIIPYFSNNVIIDPDFSLLLSYVPPAEKEGSICQEKNSKKLSGAQLAGIIIGCIAFVAVITAITVYYIKFHRRKKLLMKTLQQKVASMGSTK